MDCSRATQLEYAAISVIYTSCFEWARRNRTIAGQAHLNGALEPNRCGGNRLAQLRSDGLPQ
jgi:hypothetical protein